MTGKVICDCRQSVPAEKRGRINSEMGYILQRVGDHHND